MSRFPVAGTCKSLFRDLHSARDLAVESRGVQLTCFNDMLSQVLQLQRLSKPGSLAALGIAEP
jgi:hypothetical protein